MTAGGKENGREQRGIDMLATDESNKFVGGKTGGIPRSVFTLPAGIYRDFEGKSGRPLTVAVGDRRTGIRGGNNDSITITTDTMGVSFGAAINEQGMLAVGVRNVEPNGDRHPDFYPAELIKEFVVTQQERGIEIRGMVDTWFSDVNLGANTDAYLAQVEALGREPTDEEKKAFAGNTWTGRFAAKALGFRVASVDDTDRSKPIKVTLRPPEEAGSFTVHRHRSSEARSVDQGSRRTASMAGNGGEYYESPGDDRERNSDRGESR